MGQGLQGKAALAAGTYTSVYTVSAGKAATVNIRMVNTTSSAIAIRLAICPAGYTAGATPALADNIEPLDVVLDGYGVLEETGMALSSGEVVVAYAAVTGVVVRIHGFEG